MRFRNKEVFENCLGVPEGVRDVDVPPTASAVARRLGFCLPVLRTQAGDSPSRGE